jgi:hypothetical protein
LEERVQQSARQSQAMTFKEKIMRLSLNAKLSGAAALAIAAVVASCASVPEATTEQPDLTALVQPYATRLAAEGVSRIEAPGAGGGHISVGTPYGFFEIRDRGDVAPAPFVVVSDGSTRVLSNTYTPADLPRYRAAIDRILPEVLRVAPQNEADMHELQTASH